MIVTHGWFKTCTHYVSMIYVLIVSKNCHFLKIIFLNPPTYLVLTQSIAYVIQECPVGKESGLFCSFGSKYFSNRIIIFVGLQFHDSFFMSINPKTWEINLTELFPGRITIFVLLWFHEILFFFIILF